MQTQSGPQNPISPHCSHSFKFLGDDENVIKRCTASFINKYKNMLWQQSRENFFNSMTFTLIQIFLIWGKENSNHSIWWEPFLLINIIQIVLCKVFIWVNISIPLSSSLTDSRINCISLHTFQKPLGKREGTSSLVSTYCVLGSSTHTSIKLPKHMGSTHHHL